MKSQGLYVNPVTLQTNHPKLLAAGDLLFGTQSVVDTMAQGREAALPIDRILWREPRMGRKYWDGTYITDLSIDRSATVSRPLAQLPRIPVDKRDVTMEVEKTLDEKVAKAEAERCLNCGSPAEVNQTCWYSLPREIEFPVDALEVRLLCYIR